MGLRSLIRGTVFEELLFKSLTLVFGILSIFIKKEHLIKIYRKHIPFEPEMIKELTANIIEDDDFIDVGAAVGEFSMLAAKHARRVYAIEGNEGRFKTLQANIKKYNYGNIIPIKKFISNRPGKIRIYEIVPAIKPRFNVYFNGNSDFLSINKHEGLSEQEIEVECDTLDNILKGEDISKVKGMKVDVEGAELEVIEGAKDLLSHLDFILLEFHYPPSDPRFKLIQNLLIESYNFKSTPLTRDNRYFIFKK